jgi:hypothetical protein
VPDAINLNLTKQSPLNLSKRISRRSENVSILKHWRIYTYEHLVVAAHNQRKHQRIECRLREVQQARFLNKVSSMDRAL